MLMLPDARWTLPDACPPSALLQVSPPAQPDRKKLIRQAGLAAIGPVQRIEARADAGWPQIIIRLASFADAASYRASQSLHRP